MTTRAQFKSYSEKLKDPRWQKMRLEVLEAAGWECRNCGSKEDELHVHHLRYIPGAQPWGYNNDDMCVLCKACHVGVEESKVVFELAFAQLCATTGDPWSLYRELTGYVEASMCADPRNLKFQDEPYFRGAFAADSVARATEYNQRQTNFFRGDGNH